jgi:hypothetical protein
MTGITRSIDFVTGKRALIASIAAVLFAAGAGLMPAQNGSADTSQDAAKTAAKQKAVAAGEAEAKRLLLLMDKDQSGGVSRQEFMDFMTAEFDRLDKNKDGELDVRELTQTRLTAPPRGAIHR